MLNYKQKQKKYGFKYQQLLVWDKRKCYALSLLYECLRIYINVKKAEMQKILIICGTKNILRIPNIIGTKTHPTEKPVELMKILIENSSNKDDIVLDCFGGSGSTLLACERANRIARLIEIDPQYCNVAIYRWEKLTNKKAKFVRNILKNENN